MATSLKHRYPFRLATTSFIHPADYATNVRRLAPVVDEVELLFLERDHLPSADDIRDLSRMAMDLDVGYNIHLPMDISIANPSPDIRRRSRDAILKALELALPLNASTHTLHLTYEETDNQPDTQKAWQACAIESLSRLLEKAPVPPKALSAETLNFPPGLLLPIIRRCGLSACVDVGHLIRFGFDVQETLNRFSSHVAIYHLHGVTGTRDHRALNHLSAACRKMIVPLLNRFSGSVSLEVFSLPDLTDSLDFFKQMMEQNQPAEKEQTQ